MKRFCPSLPPTIFWFMGEEEKNLKLTGWDNSTQLSHSKAAFVKPYFAFMACGSWLTRLFLQCGASCGLPQEEAPLRLHPHPAPDPAPRAGALQLRGRGAPRPLVRQRQGRQRTSRLTLWVQGFIWISCVHHVWSQLKSSLLRPNRALSYLSSPSTIPSINTLKSHAVQGTFLPEGWF